MATQHTRFPLSSWSCKIPQDTLHRLLRSVGDAPGEKKNVGLGCSIVPLKKNKDTCLEEEVSAAQMLKGFDDRTMSTGQMLRGMLRWESRLSCFWVHQERQPRHASGWWHLVDVSGVPYRMIWSVGPSAEQDD